jgi:anhydro-N-acetylmuramic acid kinase
MSGTSLDGLDMVFCEFEKIASQWNYSILHAQTIPYSDDWRRRLSSVETASAFEFVQTDVEYGHLTGKLVRNFMETFRVLPDFIASHGHTIFHQPGKGITAQIGSGAAIAAETGLPVVCDFRTLDVALGGQGAPLVPIGDDLLFHDVDYCLNIGGFANISFQRSNQRIAFDICPANIVLNNLSALAGKEYDQDGMMAREGKTDDALLQKLNAIEYYFLAPPKSLGKEWVINSILPILKDYDLSINDLMATFCEHIAIQIGQAIQGNPSEKLMITGGGAFNLFLIERIRHYSAAQVFIPDKNTVNFKEALIFALLGVLRWRNEENCLSSVTGALRNSSGGAIY